jgi:antitoxin component of MazEF toxin-antitoxin module
MIQVVKYRRVGESLGISISKPLAAMVGIKPGDLVSIHVMTDADGNSYLAVYPAGEDYRRPGIYGKQKEVIEQEI